MKALAEQIAELDGVEIYGRVVGVRGLMVEVAGPIHAMSVGARVLIETGGGKPIPCEVVGFAGGNALLMPFGALDGVRRGCRAIVTSVAGGGAAVGGLARPRASTPWASRSTARARCRAGPRPIRSATRRRRRMRAARRRAARSRRARAQHLHHLLPRPAHGHLRRLRRRQVGAAVDAGAQRRRRRVGHRAGRRARPRGAGIPPGRSRRRGPGALGGGGRRPPTSPP